MRRASSAIARIGCLLLCAVWGRGAAAQQPDEDALVKQFFPQWLTNESIDDFNAGGPRPFQASAHAHASLDGPGRGDFIVAAYTNGFSGAVIVLAKEGGAMVERASPSFPLMSGVTPCVRAIDVDGDGRQEAVVGFSSARGREAEWVLQWDGATLRSIGPAAIDGDGNVETLLNEALFVDLDGDGVVEIIAAPEFDPSADMTGPSVVYALANGTYAPSRTLDLFETFARPAKTDKNRNDRDDARPDVAMTAFNADVAAGPHVMTIVNGDPSGAHRVRNVEIQLNGVVVARSDALAQDARMVDIPISVTTSNTLRVTLRGPRDTWLMIAVGPK